MRFYEDEHEHLSHNGRMVSLHLYCADCSTQFQDGPRVLTHTEVTPFKDDHCQCCKRMPGQGLVRPTCHHDWRWDLAAEPS